MSKTDFMQKRFSLEELVNHYQNDIRALREQITEPSDEHKLQTYYFAAGTFKGISMNEIVKFVLSLGRSQGAKAEQMRNAFPTLIGNRTYHPSGVDHAYFQLLLEYSQAFKLYRKNMSDWMLRFIISSRFSPISHYVEQELTQVIEQTKRRLR